jgi:hypothetical protein
MTDCREDELGFATISVALFLALACFGQTVSQSAINTSSAGVRAGDVEAAAGTICHSHDITRSKDGNVSGCRVCPEGTDFYGDGHSGWEIYAETPGHFTSPQDDNLLLDGTGCDSHASNFGGSFMFALKSGKARLLRYDQGLATEQCHKFAFADGRDFLICRGGSTFQGESSETIFMAAFDGAGKAAVTKLISAANTRDTCHGDIKFSTKRSTQSGQSGASGESAETTGMTITAMQGSGDCSQAQRDEKTGKPSRAVKSYDIEFLFDGQHFDVAPASRTALSRFDTN